MSASLRRIARLAHDACRDVGGVVTRGVRCVGRHATHAADAWSEALNVLQPRTAAGASASGRSDVERELASLRADMTSWLAAHPEVNVELPERSDDPKTEMTALRLAATAICAALKNADGGAASPFYLGRVDVSVTAGVPAPGMTVAGVEQGQRLRDRQRAARRQRRRLAAPPCLLRHVRQRALQL
jgi:hypothetical protein